MRFGAKDTPIELRAGFAELREAVASVAGGQDVDTLTEVLWAALHGLTTLGRSSRLRPGGDTERIELLVAQFYDAQGQAPRESGGSTNDDAISGSNAPEPDRDRPRAGQ